MSLKQASNLTKNQQLKIKINKLTDWINQAQEVNITGYQFKKYW